MAMQDMQAYSFTPGLAQRFKSSANGQLSPNESQALQVLSLRLPSFLSGSPIAPDALLQPRFGGVSPDTAVRAQTAGSPAPPQQYNPPSTPTLSAGPVGSAPLGVIGPSAGSVAAPPAGAPTPGAPPGAPYIGFGGGSSQGPTGGAGTSPSLSGLMDALFGTPVAGGGSSSKQF